MELVNAFEVPAPPERVWDVLLDVQRIAPCMPGAELTEVVDDRTWKGKVHLKLGPVSLSFAGTVVMQERDDAAKRVVLKAEGRETRGKGAASANVTSELEPLGGGGTRVRMVTDLTISGAVAQYGRGMIGDVSKRLTNQFASCLQEEMAATPAPAAAPTPAAAVETASTETGGAAAPSPSPAVEPSDRPVAPPRRTPAAVGGLRLGVWALGRALLRLLARAADALARLFRRSS